VSMTATLKYADDNPAVSKQLSLLELLDKNTGATQLIQTKTTDASGKVKFDQTMAATKTFIVRATDTSFCYAADSSCPSAEQIIKVSPVTYTMQLFNPNTAVCSAAGELSGTLGSELASTDLLTVNTNYIAVLKLEESGTTSNASRAISMATTLGAVDGAQVSNSTVTDTDTGSTSHFEGKTCFDVSSPVPGKASLEANTVSDAGAALTALRPAVFVSNIPSKIIVQATQTNLLPLGQTQISAKVEDAKDTPVQGRRVYFNLVDTSGGGFLSSASAVTDAKGVATVTYTAGELNTAKDKVTITATPENTALSATAYLTVGGKSSFVSMGTGLSLEDNDTYYLKAFSVSVTDINGLPIANATLDLSVIPLTYYKGYYEKPSGDDDKWNVVVTAPCDNEDINLNGRNDTGEDINNDSILWPGGPVTVTSGTVTTDANGIATFKIQYMKTYANWVKVKIAASTTVTGTESHAERIYEIGATVPDMNKSHAPPGGEMDSPFGIASLCTSKD